MARGFKVSVAVRRDDGEEDVFVTGMYYPGDPGRTYGPPENCYPPEPDEFEVTESIDSNGKSVELTDDEYERAIEAACAAGPDEADLDDFDPPDEYDVSDYDIEKAENAYERNLFREPY